MRLSIGKRLLLGFLFLFFLELGIVAAGIINISRLSELNRQAFKLIVPMERVYELRLSFRGLVMPINDYLNHGNIIEKKVFKLQTEEVSKEIAEVKDLFPAEAVPEFILIAEESFQRIKEMSEKLFQIESPVGNVEGAMLMEETDAFMEKASEAIEEYHKKYLDRQLGLLKIKGSYIVRNSISVFLFFSFLGIGLSFPLSYVLARRIQRPIVYLGAACKRLASGQLSGKVEIKTQDEIEELAHTFNQMVDDLRRHQEEKTQRNQFIETVTQGVEEDLMLLDMNLKILWVSKRVSQNYGVKVGEIIDNYCYMKDEFSARPKENCAIRDAISTGRPSTVLHTRLDKEGNKSYMEVTVYPVKNSNGDIIQFIHVAHNVTEMMRMIEELKATKTKIEEYTRTLENRVAERTRDLMVSMKEADERRLAILNILEDIDQAHQELTQANQELKEAQAKLIQTAKMAAVGELAGGVAHEINNPLTGVLNNVQLIKLEAEAKKDFLPPDLKELLDVVEESALRCKRITQGLLDFSRAGKRPHKPTHINQVIEDSLILAEREIRLENIKLSKELSADLPEVLADPNQLQQVFLDILNNAKWALKGREQAELRIKTESRDNHKSVMITISDNGCGILAENLGRVFEPFFTTKKPGEGTGLGLSIGYGIIKEHSGTIEVASEGKDKGATFKVILPAIIV